MYFEGAEPLRPDDTRSPRHELFWSHVAHCAAEQSQYLFLQGPAWLDDALRRFLSPTSREERLIGAASHLAARLQQREDRALA